MFYIFTCVLYWCYPRSSSPNFHHFDKQKSSSTAFVYEKCNDGTNITSTAMIEPMFIDILIKKGGIAHFI